MGEHFADLKGPVARGCIDEVNDYQVVLVLSLLFEEPIGFHQGPTGNRWGD